MSMTIGTFTTAHLESATGPHGQPLPIRERIYGDCAGHCGCAMDWAALTEMAAERFFPNNSSSQDRNIDMYHHQTVDSGVGAWAFGGYVESCLGVNNIPFLDPSWTPQDIANNGWDFYANFDNNPPVGRILHEFKRSSRRLLLNNDPFDQDSQIPPKGHTSRETSKTPRNLDEMRRLFYDMKQLYRIKTNCTITYSENQNIAFEHWYGGTETEIGPGTITLGADVLALAQRVRDTQGYGVRNSGAAWAMVEMWCAKDNPQIYNTGNLKRTLCIPCTLGGTLDTSRFNPQALKSWMLSAYGTFADGHDYYATARIAAVYADIDFPSDYIFTGWDWQPSEGV